jgi:hypothetical protein
MYTKELNLKIIASLITNMIPIMFYENDLPQIFPGCRKGSGFIKTASWHL